MRALALFGFALCLAFSAGPARSQGSLGSTSTHLYLVQDCTDAGWASGDVGVKCFESLSSLMTKIWDTGGLFPTAGTPLIVDIGPGEFSGSIDCPADEGHVTFRGAGRSRTVIKNTGGTLTKTVTSSWCEDLAFQDLKIVAVDTTGSTGYAVFWEGGGSSNWTDVEIEGDGAAWYDYGCGGASTDASDGEHYFWGSSLRGGRIGYYAECGLTWFYGGEIEALTSIAGSWSNPAAGVWVTHRGEVQVFGTAIKVSTAGGTSGTGTAYGARVGIPGNGSGVNGYGAFHSHGGVIAVDSSTRAGVAAIGISLNLNSGVGDAMSHTLGTAFVVNGGASSTRLSGTGMFMSPQLWEARTSPPTAGGGIDGQDIYVETDCNSSGCSGASDPHLMIYKAACTTNGPWFDIVRNACRN